MDTSNTLTPIRNTTDTDFKKTNNSQVFSNFNKSMSLNNKGSRQTLIKLNPLLQCALCEGYLVDATKLTECNHTFCRACIWLEYERRLQKCTCKPKQPCKCFICPVSECKSMINKYKPWTSLRSDSTLQDIIYKLVPDLYQNEMERRKKFYKENTDPTYENLSQEEKGEIPEHRVYYTLQDKISLSLEYGFGDNQQPTCELNNSNLINESLNSSQLKPSFVPSNSPIVSSSTENSNSSSATSKNSNLEAAATRRYLLCPAGIKVSLLQKFILYKYDLNEKLYSVHLFYLQDQLDSDLNLIDIAYIFNWKRNAPLRLFYRIAQLLPNPHNSSKIKPAQLISDQNKQFKIENNQQSKILTTSQNNVPQQAFPQPVAKKPRLDPAAISSSNVNRSTPPVSVSSISAQNSAFNSPIRHSLSPVSINTSTISSSPKPISKSTSSVQNINSNNQLSNTTKASLNVSISSNNQTIAKPNTLKRSLSKSKLNITDNSNINLQLNRPLFNKNSSFVNYDQGNCEFEPAQKFRKILPANFSNMSEQQLKSFSQPVVTMPNQQNSANFIQRKQSITSPSKNSSQLVKMCNVNSTNSSNNSYRNINSNNMNSNLNSLQSSSTVTSLRNVRVPNTDKKKTIFNSSNIQNNISLSKNSSQPNASKQINNQYNVPSNNSKNSVNNVIMNKNNTNSPPKTPFNIVSILGNESSNKNNMVSTQQKEKLNDMLTNSNNSSSLASLNQLKSSNLNQKLPTSPTSASNHKRRSNERSPKDDIECSVTEKGIKIKILSPTGYNNINNLSSSMHINSLTSSNYINSFTNAKNNSTACNNNLIEKFSPNSAKTNTNNEKQNSNNQLEKSFSSVLNGQVKHQITSSLKPEEAKKQNLKLNNSVSVNNSNTLSINGNSRISTAPTLEAVGLSSKFVNTNIKKGASINQIVNKLTSNGIGKSVAVSATTSISFSSNSLTKSINSLTTANLTNSSSNKNNNLSSTASLSFAQAVNNGLKTAAEQKLAKDAQNGSIKPSNDNSLTIRLPISNNNLDSKMNVTNKKDIISNSKSLFSNSKIEVTIEDDEPNTNLSQNKLDKNLLSNAEQVFSDVDVDVDDDDSMEGKLVMVIPETENSCSSSAPDENKQSKLSSCNQTLLKQQQKQSFCAIQANTPPSSSPDFSKKFPSSRSSSPVLLTTNNDKTVVPSSKKIDQIANPVSPPLTPSPRLCDPTSSKENNFGALDLSTGPRKSNVAITAASLPEPTKT